MTTNKTGLMALLAVLGVVLAAPAFAAAPETYRNFFGHDSRITIWLIAEIHLMFGAFVLGVPIFAVTIELIGWKTQDPRYDQLAYEFTQLLGGGRLGLPPYWAGCSPLVCLGSTRSSWRFCPGSFMTRCMSHRISQRPLSAYAGVPC